MGLWLQAGAPQHMSSPPQDIGLVLTSWLLSQRCNPFWCLLTKPPHFPCGGTRGSHQRTPQSLPQPVPVHQRTPGPSSCLPRRFPEGMLGDQVVHSVALSGNPVSKCSPWPVLF